MRSNMKLLDNNRNHWLFLERTICLTCYLDCFITSKTSLQKSNKHFSIFSVYCILFMQHSSTTNPNRYL